MKIVIAFALIVLFAVYVSAMRNVRDNKEVNLTEAIELVQASANKLTFNDNKSSAGKLHHSWRIVPKDNFELFEETGKGYIIKGVNKKNNQSLYFLIDKQGHVLEVMEESYFKKTRNHMR
ncbi:DUF6488 family protein [Aliikangiella sp. IMCC44359]|uniref:DUF6488 family protein n=1 Tax=Aliikangiella sp. IMCC44359 TaxID=3459125 RepID=UPI00403AE283